MTTQTEAERLAVVLMRHDVGRQLVIRQQAAAELRRLVSFNQQLMDEVARLNKAVADEREACAKVIEEAPCECCWPEGSMPITEDLAAAIRARGNT